MAVPVLEHVCFDVHGQSPLVKHYLQKRKLDRDAGYAILTKRTEVNQPPPYPLIVLGTLPGERLEPH